MTTKADVFADEVDGAWLALRQEVDRLEPDDFEAVTPAGWTVKEMLAHVAFWAETVEMVIVGQLRGEPISETEWYGGDDLGLSGAWPHADVHNAREAEWARRHSTREVLQRLAGSISTEEMRRLNYEVDGNKRPAADVVREWRQSKGF